MIDKRSDSSAPCSWAAGELSIRPSFREFSHTADGNCCGGLDRPVSGTDSVVHNGGRNAVFLCHCRPGGPIMLCADDAAMPRLLFRGGPSAVSREIAEIVVLALNGQVITVARLIRPFGKNAERVPFIADRYPFLAIAFLGLVSASGQHVLPAVVQARSRHTMGSRSCAHGRPRRLAAAGSALSVAHVGPKNCTLGAARASCKPKSTTALCVSRLGNNGPVAKGLTCKVDQSGIFCHV